MIVVLRYVNFMRGNQHESWAGFECPDWALDNNIILYLFFFHRLFENSIATTLREHEASGIINLFSWKNAEQEEVNFVIQQAGRVIALNHLNSASIKEHEIRLPLK